jgi:phage-related protein
VEGIPRKGAPVIRLPEYEGNAFTIQALVLSDGTSPVGQFLDALSRSDRTKLDVLFERLGDHGKITNPEKFKKLTDTEDIWEFKSSQIRILCFFVPGRLVLLAHALNKKQNKHRKADIEIAEGRRRWYLSQQEKRR